MDMTAQLISSLEDAAALLRRHVSLLSDADLARPLPETDVSVGEGLAQLVGWQEHTLSVLPKMLEQIEVALPPVNAAERNAKSAAEHGGKSLTCLLGEFSRNHERLLMLLRPVPPEALTLRRTRNGQIFTVKSYVLDTFQQKVLEFVDRLQLME